MAKEAVICDTDVVIDYWNINSSRYNHTQAILEDLIGVDNVILSGITQMELLIGATNKSDLARVKKNIRQFNISLVNDSVNFLAIDLIEKYRLSHGLMLSDSLIAATAIYADLSLFTYNVKDYKFIHGLKLYNPVI